ncbi:PH and SEC7 domain-containing protein 3 isoform X2 [Tupaia chinensis]|uniref:PH and SEC7 domain-containing protein 3 isoform X2 n=1 Tax=Tupaia chinensis TaxID=246437 RepID=UPI0007043551|nr:PH and SEC7 domain-containing protein 3 isoform X2 [Tupaia chinensis]
MAEQPRQQQMKTSFLYTQLQAPPAPALPAQSPAAVAWTAAPGGLEEGHVFPSPGTGFLAGWGLRRTQGLAAPPASRQKEGPGRERPAAFVCSAPKEQEAKERARDGTVRTWGVCGSLHRRWCLSPDTQSCGRRPPLPGRLPSTVPVMSDGPSDPSAGWNYWPVTPALRDLSGRELRPRDASGCSIPQATLAQAADGGYQAVPRGAAACQVPPLNCEDGPGTRGQGKRAQLCRYCPRVQTSQSYPALPAAQPLKAETFVWANSASAHSQSVAKAKYEFLFGRSEEKTPATSDHGGSTLLPPNVTNEFPEYGTMEEGGEGLGASLEFDAESQPCCPQGQQGTQGLAGHHSVLDSVTKGPKDVREASSQSHLKEQSLQPIDSLISALKATEARIASGTLQATKVPDGDAVSGLSVQLEEKEPDTALHRTQRAKKPFPAGQEQSPDIPLSADVTSEDRFDLSIQKDLTALLTGKTQAELSQITENGQRGVLCAQAPACPVSSPGNAAVIHSSAGSIGFLKEERSHVGGEHPRVYDRGSSMGRSGRVKHVEFQGVEILWTGEKKETQHPADFETSLERTASPGSREFSQVPSHCIPSAGGCSSVRETTSVWDATWKGPAQRPGTSSGTVSPVPLAESGEDEVFLKDSRQHLEKKSELERDQNRILEQEEHLRGGEDDVLGPGYTEDSTDVYSSQFETILDNTSLYYSAESLETLYSEPDSYFSFELPLTPMIQQRIKEGGQFLERTSAGEQQDVLSVSSDGGIVMGYSTGVTNGLNDASDTLHTRGSPELAFWGSNVGVKTTRLDDHSEMGSTEILEKEASESLSNGTSSNVEAAKRLAKRLYQLDRFKRSDVAKHLGKNNEFSKLVAEEYLKFFDFTGMTLDQSLRYFFKAFSLAGETQERERVLIHFSNRYFYCNPNTIASQDGVHCLTCAMMLLNTDLHGHNIGKKMTCQEFIANLQGVNEGVDFSKDLLKALYNSIKNEKLEWAVDDEEKKKSPTEGTDEKANGTHPKTISRIGSTTNPFLDIPHDPNAAVYKSGFLARKIHADMDGKKTPRGKRGWKTFYAVLKGTVLYLQKDEYKPEKALSEEDLKNAVSVHHALASKATDYEKKPNVFKLKTADWRVLLFQAQSPEEMQGWINKINCVAAVFSAPPFPAAIGSQKKFSRPLLPATTTKLSQEEQLKSHESKLKQITTELAEHRSYPPDKKVKAKDVDEYKLKDHYLEFECQRPRGRSERGSRADLYVPA